jgi:hypothetical protein
MDHFLEVQVHPPLHLNHLGAADQEQVVDQEEWVQVDEGQVGYFPREEVGHSQGEEGDRFVVVVVHVAVDIVVHSVVPHDVVEPIMPLGQPNFLPNLCE